MRLCFLILILSLPVQAYVQQETCFKKWLNRGIKAFNAYDMRAAVTNLDAAMECDVISVQDSLEVETWKKKIDVELQRLVDEFEAEERLIEEFRLSIIEEKINSSMANSRKKNYLKANSLLDEALDLFYLLPEKERSNKRSEIETLKQSNDSLNLVQKKFNKLIGDGDFLKASSLNNSIPSLIKYMEAFALNFDTGISNAKIALLKEETFNCLNTPCFLLNNNEQTYFTLASFEYLLGNVAHAKDHIHSGIKAGKMKYYPLNTQYPKEVNIYADELFKRHYWPENTFYYFSGVYISRYKFKKALFSNSYRSNSLNAYEHINFSYDASVKDSTTIEGGHEIPQIILGFFRGRRFIYGLETSIVIPTSRPYATFDSLEFEFSSKPFRYFNDNPPADTLSRYFKGLFPKERFRFDFLIGYQIPILKKNKNRHIVLVSIQPMLGPSIHLNGPWRNVEARESIELNNGRSEVNYHYSNVKSSKMYLSYYMNLNIRIYRRSYFFLRLGGRISLTKQKIFLSKTNVIREEKTYSNSNFDHKPFDIEILFKENEKGFSSGIYTRF